jgi:hypothetical protein
MVGEARPDSLAARVESARRRLFVGREAELSLFREALLAAEPPFAVLCLTGPGGVGKSALLGRMAELASEAGVRATLVDGHAIDPTPAAFLAAVDGEAGGDEGGGASDGASAGRSVVLVDHWEQLAGLEEWLQSTFVERVPASTVLVIAGRVAPGGAWETDAAWRSLVRRVRLGNLERDEAEQLLMRRGVPSAQRRAAIELSHGHPLALNLLGEVVEERDGERRELEPAAGLESMPDLVARLLASFIEGVPSERQRAALEVCAHVRVTTEPLLVAVLGEADGPAMFEWLRGLSFIESGPEGLAPHDLARDALDADLRWRNRSQYADLHHRVREHVTSRIASLRGEDQIRAAFDLFYLHRYSDIGRRLFSWRFGAGVSHRPLEPGDLPAIEALVRQYEGEGSAEIARYWLRRDPEAFRVFLDEAGEVMGVLAQLVMGRPDGAAREADPVMDAIARLIAERGGLANGERIAVARFCVIDGVYGDTSPAMDVVEAIALLDGVSIPSLACSFLLSSRPEIWDELFEYIDVPRQPEADTVIDGRRFAVYLHDWRACPPPMYLELMEARELGDISVDRVTIVPGMAEAEFRGAVKEALRDLTRRDRLAESPLVGRPFVRPEVGEEPSAALARALVEAVDVLGANPRDAKLQRVLRQTFVTPAASQEAAAELLDLPFSTYRRHLAAGIERVGTMLWRMDANRRSR